MPNLLRKRQILHARLTGIYFPRMQVEDRGPPVLVHLLHAKLRVRVGEETKVTATTKRKAPAEHFYTAHRKLVQAVSDLVRNQRRVGNAVVRVKADRKNRRVVLEAVLLEDRQRPRLCFLDDGERRRTKSNRPRFHATLLDRFQRFR